MRFLFIRHGETDWNARGVMQGSNDIPLNEIGIEQAVLATAILKDLCITRIVTSPQIRAHHTAKIINNGIGVDIHLEHDLRERHFGEYEGQEWGNIPRVPVYAESPNGPYDYPEGENVESFLDLVGRSKSAIEHWLEKHTHDVVLFVAHGGVFGAIHHALVDGTAPRVENAKPYEFISQDDGRWLCRPIGHTDNRLA